MKVLVDEDSVGVSSREGLTIRVDVPRSRGPVGEGGRTAAAADAETEAFGSSSDVLVYDYGRAVRLGMPEAVFCLDKDVSDIVTIVEALNTPTTGPVLFTRISQRQYDAVCTRTDAELDFDSRSQTAYLNGTLPRRDGRVGIVAAGTSDLRVVLEARRTLEFLGFQPRTYIDVGVAGLWRLLDRLADLQREQALIVVAGMDAALASVVGGLVGAPIVAVPTSTGYGVSRSGETALNSMLASCAQGVVVTNIDNGFGAACAVARILRVT